MPLDDAERERRRALLHAHYDVENDHDLDRIMATFSTDAEMLYNRQSFGDPESIRTAHAYIGSSTASTSPPTRSWSKGDSVGGTSGTSRAIRPRSATSSSRSSPSTASVQTGS